MKKIKPLGATTHPKRLIDKHQHLVDFGEELPRRHLQTSMDKKLLVHYRAHLQGNVKCQAHLRGRSGSVNSGYPIVRNLVFGPIIGEISLLTVPAEFSPLNRAVSWRRTIFGQFLKRRIFGLIGRVEEKRKTITVSARAWENSVKRSPITIIAPDLHDVADVHHQRTGHGLDRHPFLTKTHLQPAYIVLKEDRQGSCIRMMVNAEMTGLGSRLLLIQGIVFGEIVQSEKA